MNQSAGVKHDEEKAPLALIPSIALEQEALAFADGRDKYGTWNYTRGLSSLRLASAVMRHVTAWLEGEETVPDSKHGAHHLGCARAGLAMLLQLQKLGRLDDDRLNSSTAPSPTEEPIGPLDAIRVEPTSSTKSNLQLEVGKSYRRKDGRVFKVVRHDPGRSWGGVPHPYITTSGDSFTAAGLFCAPDVGNLDLIAEVTK